MNRLREGLNRLAAPVPALPVDAFRIAAAVLLLGYLVRLLVESPNFHAGNGLLDHALSESIFWFTWQPLFRPGMPLWSMQAILFAGCALAIGILAGWHPRRCALALYVIVVCSIRHNFLVISVDDVIMHLLLFWLILLPSGTTLCLADRAHRGAWPSRSVPGGTVRLFCANIALIYFVAGVTKWASPMWQEGHALYAVLSVRPGWFSGGIDPALIPLLRGMNYGALLIEPFLALIPFLRPGRVKNALGLLLIVFHAGIIAGLDVVFANLACLAALILLFRTEWMGRVHAAPVRVRPGRWRPVDSFAALVLLFLVGAMACSMTQVNWRKPTADHAALASGESRITRMVGGPEQLVFFGGLWGIGLIQQYRLLDWIDDRNFSVRFDITETGSCGMAEAVHEYELVPPGMRGSLALSYLLGATWLPVPAERMPELRRALHRRLAERYARGRHDCFVEVRVAVQRIHPVEPGPLTRDTLMRFHCQDGAVVEQEMNLSF